MSTWWKTTLGDLGGAQAEEPKEKNKRGESVNQVKDGMEKYRQ
jgi:hypothetical protein